MNRNPQILKFDDGSTQTHLKKANVIDMIVRLPTLDVQLQIAKAISALDKLVSEVSESLPLEIKKRRQQYEFYRCRLLSFNELDVA